MMILRKTALASALLASTAIGTAYAADVTSDRLINADKEPQNWLMNHRTYSGQRYSPLNMITRDNVKNLKLAYAVSLGGNQTGNYTESTPLAEDGFLYMTDNWGVLYKVDATKGNLGRIVWSMDPGEQKPATANRGAALWGNFVISTSNYPARVIATNKATGEVVWDQNLTGDTPRVELTGAPLAVKDKLLVGAAGGDNGTRAWLAGLDAATGKTLWKQYNIPAPGEPGAETWKGNTNAWQTGGAAMYVTGTYDPATNVSYWGTGNPVPMFDPTYRPGDNLYTNSVIARDADTGAMKWYFQFTPGDMWDFDEEGTHIIVNTTQNGEARKMLFHSGRNGFIYALDAGNGLFVAGAPYIQNLNWTKGLDPKTGKPVDYDPNKDIQTYSGVANETPKDPTKKVCPTIAGGNNFWPSTYSLNTNRMYIPAMTGCVTVTTDPAMHTVALGFTGGKYVVDQRLQSDLIKADPMTATIEKRVSFPYTNYSGAVSTAGGLVFTALTDGTVAAFDDQSLDQLWSFNVGSGFSAPPMTFAVNGKQYVAITSGMSPAARSKLAQTPELAEQRNETSLFVFGL